MSKTMIGNSRVGISPSVIVGAVVDGKANYITLGQCSGLSMNPPMMYISINKAHYTNKGIKEAGYFSINIPNDKVVQKMDYVGVVSVRDTDKSDVFKIFYGSVDKAPMIEECPVNILCEVAQVVDLENYDVFFGNIVETYVNDDCLTDGKPDMKKVNQVILSGGKYCYVGEECGTAFSDGRALIKK
ncbi:MAG: flavin reductase family protein [Dehalococcoidales bacterium]|nr:flavin reductase family protein [Dehalococcoidales bacterium]